MSCECVRSETSRCGTLLTANRVYHVEIRKEAYCVKSYYCIRSFLAVQFPMCFKSILECF